MCGEEGTVLAVEGTTEDPIYKVKMSSGDFARALGEQLKRINPTSATGHERRAANTPGYSNIDPTTGYERRAGNTSAYANIDPQNQRSFGRRNDAPDSQGQSYQQQCGYPLCSLLEANLGQKLQSETSTL